MTHRSTHRDKDAKFEPSRSRRLNAIKAKTNGMLAIHAARRQVYLTLRSFIGVISALLLLLGATPYSTDSVNLSSGQSLVALVTLSSAWARISTWNFLLCHNFARTIYLCVRIGKMEVLSLILAFGVNNARPLSNRRLDRLTFPYRCFVSIPETIGCYFVRRCLLPTLFLGFPF